MKHVRRIIVWVMISLSLQLAGLFYIDRYFLAESSMVKSKKVEVKTQEEAKNIDIKVPEGAKHIGISYNGKYLSYYEGDLLKIINTKDAQAKSIELEEGSTISFYKWLPDRNRMLIAEKVKGKYGINITLSYYDVDKDVKMPLEGDIKNSNYLKGLDKKSEVEDMQFSTLTNIIYVKVAHAGQRSTIYRIDIMGSIKKVQTMGYMVGTIGIVPHEDKLVYEDLTYRKLYVTGSQKAISIKGASNLKLLAIDNEDNLYVGEVEAERVKKIYYGNLKDDTDSWKSIDLKEGMNEKDIYITSEGNIYLNDNLRGKVTEHNSAKETPYTGIFMEMYSGGIASIDDGNLIKTNFK